MNLSLKKVRLQSFLKERPTEVTESTLQDSCIVTGVADYGTIKSVKTTEIDTFLTAWISKVMEVRFEEIMFNRADFASHPGSLLL